MKLAKKLFLIIGVLLSLTGINTAFSQEESIAQIPLVQESNSEPEVQWIWGEVTSVDVSNNKVNVKYLDFENDIEKETTITIDEKTTYDNISSISQLKPNDIVSVDYTPAPGGVNIAKSISIEKPEENQTLKELPVSDPNTQE